MFHSFITLGGKSFADGESNILITAPPAKKFYFSTDIFDMKSVDLEGEGGEFLSSPAGVLGSFFSILFSVAGVLMVVLLAVYGTQMIYSQVSGNVNNFMSAKKRVVDIALGSCLLLFSWIILNFVNPDILTWDPPELGGNEKFFGNGLEINETDSSSGSGTDTGEAPVDREIYF